MFEWRILELATKQEQPASYLTTSLLQQLGIFHSLANFWENTDFARDGNRELLISQHNWKTDKDNSCEIGWSQKIMGRIQWLWKAAASPCNLPTADHFTSQRDYSEGQLVLCDTELYLKGRVEGPKMGWMKFAHSAVLLAQDCSTAFRTLPSLALQYCATHPNTVQKLWGI